MSIENKDLIKIQKRKLKKQIESREKKVKDLCKKMNDIEN